MSKPIKVVVVVVNIVVDVFVKQKLCQKNFDPKIIHVQKTLGLEVLDKKEFGKKKARSQKVLVQKFGVK